MARQRYVVVEDNKVTNVVVWDPEQSPTWNYDGPGKLMLAPDDTVVIGCLWDGERFTSYAEPGIPLEVLQRDSMVRIDRAFRYVTGGVLIDDAKREELRRIALDGINEITKAPDAQAVAVVEAKVIIALNAAAPTIGG